MRITRRAFNAGLAAGALGLPRLVRADIAIGGGTLTTISDGHLLLPGDFHYALMPQDDLMPILDARGADRQQVNSPCSVTLYQQGDMVVLFDVGSGSAFMPTAGKLSENLGAAGISPDDVTDIVLTHAHPDHLWGLLDDFDDPLFPDAQIHMGKTEWDYWTASDTLDIAPEALKGMVVGAQRRLAAIEDGVSFFDDGDEVLPGIAAMATFGHTPGHMSFEIRQGSEAAVVAGDVVVNDHVNFEQPDWLLGSDNDPEAGAATRKRLLDKLASEQTVFVGFHLPEGGLGRVERNGSGYRFVPAE